MIVIIEYINFLYCCMIFEMNFIVVYHSIEYRNFPKHPLIIGHLGCFCHFAIVNNTVMNNFCIYNLFHILGNFLTIEIENKVTGPEIVNILMCPSFLGGRYGDWIGGSGKVGVWDDSQVSDPCDVRNG